MATDFSMLSIFNAALISQGEIEIVSNNEGSDEWRLLARNWPGIVEAELEDGAYHFTRVEHFLQTREDGGFGYDDAFLIPQSALHVRKVWTLGEAGHRMIEDWTQDGERVHINQPEGCYVETVETTNTRLWSANFVKGVQFKLEAVIARAFREEYSEAQELEQSAELHFQRARTNSSKTGRAKPMYGRGPIASARRTPRGRF